QTVSWPKVLQVASGLALGLLPQLVFDITHQFQQLGIFVLWIGHKILEFVSFQAGGTVGSGQYVSAFLKYGGRIFSTDHLLIRLIFLLLIGSGIGMAIHQFRQRKLPPAILLVELALL